MKKLLILLPLVLFFAGQAFAAYITEIEYFFDTDPGYGNGTAVSVSPSQDLDDLDFTVNTAGLSTGVHILHIRSKDSSNTWSLDYTTPIHIMDAPATRKIQAVEYFFDTDPGYGNGSAVFVSPSQDLDTLNFIVDTNGLSAGQHIFHVRSKSSNDTWSLDTTTLIQIVSVQGALDIIKIEYFIDTDPGFDQGTEVPVSPFRDGKVTFGADLTGLAAGTHTLFVRSKNTAGKYSLVLAEDFVISIDSDNDGLPDAWEISMFGSITLYNQFSDPDNDGLSMLDEYRYQTDPFNPDSDADGILDGDEVDNGLDPLEGDDLLSVSTESIDSVTHNSAEVTGSVLQTGADPVTQRGICWNTSPHPTTANNKVEKGSEAGYFTGQLTGLSPLTEYYARTYAVCNGVTVYGEVKQFSTIKKEDYSEEEFPWELFLHLMTMKMVGVTSADEGIE